MKLSDSIPTMVERMISGTMLYSFPPVASEILNCLHRTDKDTKTLANIIQCEPSLAVNLLMRINSPDYGQVDQIESIEQAVNHLGLKESMAMAVSHILCNKLMSQNAHKRSGLLNDIWRRSILTGVICEYMNQNLDLGHRCHYASGLLSHIGSLVLLETYRDTYAALYDRCNADHTALATLELQRFSTTNAACRDWLIRQWDIPLPIAEPFIESNPHHPTKTILKIASSVTNEICLYWAKKMPAKQLGEFTIKYLKQPKLSELEKCDANFSQWIDNIRAEAQKELK